MIMAAGGVIENAEISNDFHQAPGIGVAEF